MRLLILPILLMVLACFSEAQTEPALADRQLPIFWTDAAPVLDGKMEEACWKTAKVAGDFRTFQKPEQKASQQTEVRACYDARDLYLFYRLFDQRMEKLFYGPPEDMRDMLNFSGDVAELFLDPGRTRERKYQFCASPLGTRFDGGPERGPRYNPNWKVKAAIYKDHWSLEMAIPFSELALDGEYYGTPQKGDVWGIQFCRDQASLHEWSQWVPTPRSFHEVKLFGTAVFRGRKNGQPLPEVRLSNPTPLFFGSGQIGLTMRNFSPDAEASGTLRQGRKTVIAKKVPAAESLDFPYHITASGRWSFQVVLQSGGQAVYSGFTFSDLPHVDRMLQAIESNIREARKRLGHFAHPEAGALQQKVEQLEKSARGPLAAFQKAATLSRSQWQDLVQGVESLGKTWKKIEFDLHLVQIYPPGRKAQKFAVGLAGPHDKVYRRALFKGDLAGPARIALAGRETESFQLVVIPFWTDLESVEVNFSDLRGPGGVIPSTNLRYSIVDYVRLKGIEADDGNAHVLEPDILWPGKPFPVPQGTVQSVYVDVSCPPGTRAGDYAGAVTISCSGQRIKKKLIAHVYGFDLPKVSSLENNFWFGPANYNWGRFYGTGCYGKIPYTLETYKKQAAVLSRYRITPFCDDTYTLLPHLKIYREKDGRFSFDFSQWAEFIRVGKECGGNSWRGSLSCNLGAMGLFSDGVKVIDRATGEEKPMSDYTAEWKKEFKAGRAYWDNHPVYPQYLKAYVAFLKKMNLLEHAYFEIYDEPNSNPRWLDMIRHHTWLKQYVPELKLTAYGLEPLREQAGKKIVGLCDVWAPNLRVVTPEVHRSMLERRTRYGEKFWFYTCGEAQDKDGNPAPYIRYDRSYVSPRIHAWYAWQLEADGMLIFAISGVPKEDVHVKAREKQWPNSEWSDGGFRGCGTLIYPGPNFRVIPGMRLASIRDGLEDYEYFKLLADLASSPAVKKRKALRKRIRNELRIENDIIDGIYKWTRDTGRLNEKRARLARLIEEAKP